MLACCADGGLWFVNGIQAGQAKCTLSDDLRVVFVVTEDDVDDLRMLLEPKKATG